MSQESAGCKRSVDAGIGILQGRRSVALVHARGVGEHLEQKLAASLAIQIDDLYWHEAK